MLFFFFFFWKELASEFQVGLEKVPGNSLLSRLGQESNVPFLLVFQFSYTTKEVWSKAQGAIKLDISPQIR